MLVFWRRGCYSSCGEEKGILLFWWSGKGMLLFSRAGERDVTLLMVGRRRCYCSVGHMVGMELEIDIIILLHILGVWYCSGEHS